MLFNLFSFAPWVAIPVAIFRQAAGDSGLICSLHFVPQILKQSKA